MWFSMISKAVLPDILTTSQNDLSLLGEGITR
jgi:hypothetical protein